MSASYRKRAIPEATRRGVAAAYGCQPGETLEAHCYWCAKPGEIHWARLSDGRPGAWVTFPGLELDHVHPEIDGGSNGPENFVLACRSCNARRRHRSLVPHDILTEVCVSCSRLAHHALLCGSRATHPWKGREGKGREIGHPSMTVTGPRARASWMAAARQIRRWSR